MDHYTFSFDSYYIDICVISSIKWIPNPIKHTKSQATELNDTLTALECTSRPVKYVYILRHF
jgi:hypothetical protein